MYQNISGTKILTSSPKGLRFRSVTGLRFHLVFGQHQHGKLLDKVVTEYKPYRVDSYLTKLPVAKVSTEYKLYSKLRGISGPLSNRTKNFIATTDRRGKLEKNGKVRPVIFEDLGREDIVTHYGPQKNCVKYRIYEHLGRAVATVWFKEGVGIIKKYHKPYGKPPRE